MDIHHEITAMIDFGELPFPRHISPCKTATLPHNKHWISMIETAMLQNDGYDNYAVE